MDELKKLFNELLIILDKYGDRSYDPQKKILKRILTIINEGDDTLDKFDQVRYEYKQLFSPKSCLSEFYIWNDDFLERKKMNEPLENIKSRLWEILR